MKPPPSPTNIPQPVPVRSLSPLLPPASSPTYHQGQLCPQSHLRLRVRGGWWGGRSRGPGEGNMLLFLTISGSLLFAPWLHFFLVPATNACSPFFLIAPNCSLLLLVAAHCTMLLLIAPCCSSLLFVSPRCFSSLLLFALCCSLLLPCCS